MTPTTINRLILIGNGFDLAHGLLTSYKDFVSAYLYVSLSSIAKNNIYEDELLKIRWDNSPYHRNLTVPFHLDEILELMNRMQRNGTWNFSFSYKSILLSNLINRISTLNWVDVENEYFEELKNCRIGGKFDYKKVRLLNKQFNCLSEKLEEYLIKVENRGSDKFSKEYLKIFRENVIESEIVLPFRLAGGNSPKEIQILSFNYTSTEKRYFENLVNNKIQVNHIHGLLENDDNPIIFGFGDEYDKDYTQFEDQKNNLLFEHIKSFNYFKTPNYHNLIRFLNSSPYQVYIMGHSCGLSDRTMLKEIFEHEKCMSIKIFHHVRDDGSNDYTEKTYEIARHFSDKGMMRKKIVPFDKTHCMPQN